MLPLPSARSPMPSSTRNPTVQQMGGTSTWPANVRNERARPEVVTSRRSRHALHRPTGSAHEPICVLPSTYRGS